MNDDDFVDEIDLEALQKAAETLDDNGHEILAEQIWYVFENYGGER